MKKTLFILFVLIASLMEVNAQDHIYTDPSGTFDDGSGPAEYADNANISYLIKPTGAKTIEINFSSFETEDGWDFVYVYDGENANAPLLEQIAESVDPNYIIKSSGGSLFIKFITNGAQTYQGWTVNYKALFSADWSVTGTSISTNSFVGIGTYKPNGKLHVIGEPDYFASIVENNGCYVYSARADGQGQIIGVNNNRSDKYALQIKNLSSNLFSLRNDGQLGIGTTSLPYKLNVAGDIFVDGGWLRTSGNAGLYFESYGGGLFMSDPYWIRTYGSKNFYHDAGVFRTDGSLQVGPNGDRFVVTQDGKVGIGTTTLSEKLEVAGNVKATSFIGDGSRLTGITGLSQWTSNNSNIYFNEKVGIGISDPGNYQLNVWGSIRAHEITVNNTGADFVFENNYKLRSLADVEAFIKANKHLPDLAPATEMQTNGVSVSDMQTKLLQKVEELTLYSIAQEKANTELKQKLAEQQKEINELKELIMKKLK